MARPPSLTFLSRLDEAGQQDLLARGRTRKYRAQSILFFEGDDAHDVMVVQAGEIKVSVSIDGREVLLDVLGPGDVLGELSAIDGGPRSATATSLGAAEVVTIPTESFMAFLSDRPLVTLDLMRAVAGRLHDTSRRQVEFGALDGLGRVCSRLVELMDRYGEPTPTGLRIAGPLSQSEIAAWAGLSREAVVKALHALRALGWVATSAKSITVLDVDAVTARASVFLS